MQFSFWLTATAWDNEYSKWYSVDLIMEQYKHIWVFSMGKGIDFVIKVSQHVGIDSV